MVTIRPYQPEDYLAITRREFDEITFKNRSNPDATARELAKGMAFTGVNEGGIIACGGVLPIWKGVGEAWAVTSPLVQKYPLVFAKTMRSKLIEIIIANSFERVQTIVDAEFRVSQRWLERMGFKYEGEMEKYISGRTYLRYAWIRRD